MVRRALLGLLVSAIVAVFGFAGSAWAQPANADPVLATKERKISPHVWGISGYPYVYFVVGTKGTLVVDTGMGTPNGKYVADIALRLSKKRKLYLAATHEHPEHGAGFGGFPAGTTIIRSRAQQEDIEKVAPTMVDRFKQRSPAWSAMLEGATYGTASTLFDKEYRLDLGGVHVRLIAVPPAHTNADVLLLVEEDKALITGDIVQSRSVTNPTGSASTIANWIQAVDMAGATGATIILPAHTVQGGAELIGINRAFLQDALKRASAAKAQGKDVAALEAELKAAYPEWQNAQNFRGLATKAMAEAK
jgi:glyoxylase-like metal-dependent hydrolase (beta-lactamase superfamily II)